MYWECGECGARLMRERPTVVCRECGRAGARFVRVSPSLDGDDDDSLRDVWLRAGVESQRFRDCADVMWAEATP